jgi:transcriptional regulator with PAS, ATPase and Fis domain
MNHALYPLMSYDWPGSVREFENFIERTLIMNRGGDLVGVPSHL